MHERLSPARSVELLASGGFAVSEQGDVNASQYYLVARAERVHSE